MSQRAIVAIGWGAHSEPLWRYQDELKLSAHMRTIPSSEEIREQHGAAPKCTVCGKSHW
jgi:hypothetical protein